MAHDIFLSYRRSDQELARVMVDALSAKGLNVWWDQLIEGGEDWRDAIVEGLTNSKALVILFSSECNGSKQLKKELAIADTLDKEVIPILIEDTKPKGHYLYELAARNWLQLYPNPETKVGELANRLASELATESPLGAATSAISQTSPEPAPSSPLASKPPVQPNESGSLQAETVEKVVAATRQKERAKKNRRDFMPFKWYELLPLLGFGALIGAVQEDPGLRIYDGIMFSALLLLFYAAIVFPIRYYFRRRRVGHAVKFYFLSTIPLAVLTGVCATLHPEFATGQNIEDLGVNIAVGMFLLFIFTIISFTIYGLLHFQRAMRSFNKNVEAI
ncbi:MAG: toll/interleukin-1 receptor domain-containing protein [Pseudomonadota bacterium]